MDLTAYQASKICNNYGMKLYTPTSSPLALSALLNFGRTSLGGSKAAEVYISGRSGNQCKVFMGDGKTKFIPCITAHNFVCELPKQMTMIQCQRYSTSYNTWSYVVTTGITSPKACYFKSAIPDQYTTLTVDATVPKESIIAIEMDDTLTVEYVPLDIAINFPNLYILKAEFCGIISLTYRSLKDLTKLRYLGLDGNNLKVLDANVLKDLGNLRRLDYSKTFLKVDFKKTNIFFNLFHS
jgi:Leucine-rich repeat (LRR) protein